MSLSVYLYSHKKEKVLCTCCNHTHRRKKLLYENNITHNLTKMAEEAGIYKAIWRPEEIGAKYSKDIIEVVTKGLGYLKEKPKYFRKFEAPNGWGTYEGFIGFVVDYLKALNKHPNSRIKVSR